MSEEEKIECFKNSLIEELGVSATWRWEDVKRNLSGMPKAELLKSMKDRKRAFDELITHLKTRDRQESRQKRQIIKDKFIQMLSEAKWLKTSSTFFEASKLFLTDSRYQNLDERDREDIFQDYLDELEKKEKEQIRNNEKARVEELLKFYEEQKVGVETTWEEVCKLIDAGDFPVWKASPQIDRLVYIYIYIYIYIVDLWSIFVDWRSQHRRRRRTKGEWRKCRIVENLGYY